MQCQHAYEIFSDYVAGQLDRALVVTLENHLNNCVACHDEVEGLQRMWSQLDALPSVDPPPFFHENLMHRLNTELSSQEDRKAWGRALWDWRTLFQPRVMAAAAAVLIFVLGGIGYMKTQQAAMGPVGILSSHSQPAPAPVPELQQPKLEWVVGAGNESTLKVQLQLDGADAEATPWMRYTIAIADGDHSARQVLSHAVPPGGKATFLLPLSQVMPSNGDPATESSSIAPTVVITVISLKDGMKQISEQRVALPPQP